MPISTTKTLLSIASTLIFAASITGPLSQPAFAEETNYSGQFLKGKAEVTANPKGGKRYLVARVLVNASPESVWKSIHEERHKDPDLAYSKVIEEKGNHSILEQKFDVLPVIGSSVCTLDQEEIPLKRIDYHLIKSDRFKAMEGSWVITPYAGGKATVLELTSYIDPGLALPRFMIENVAKGKLERRVTNVKKASELHERQLSAKNAQGKTQ